MKHSVEELVGVVFRYYPRGIESRDSSYKATEEHRRLFDARRAAGASTGKKTWNALLSRLGERFPECCEFNGSLHLPTGEHDACLTGGLILRTPPEGEFHHSVGFLISFLVPYYVVYSSRLVDSGPVYEESAQVWVTDQDAPPGDNGLQPLKRAEIPRKRRKDIALVPSPDDQTYWDAIVREIEATYGGEPMPPEVGRIVVPDVATNHRMIGEATLYDCLLTAHWP